MQLVMFRQVTLCLVACIWCLIIQAPWMILVFVSPCTKPYEGLGRAKGS
jgi:hypothetical protein